MNCINIKSPEFKALSKATGIAEHDLDFKIAQWQEANNSTEFPTVNQLINIKPGVDELFSSNPELANQVYEALGFGINKLTNNLKIPSFNTQKEYYLAKNVNSLLSDIVKFTTDNDTKLLAEAFLKIPNIDKIELNVTKYNKETKDKGTILLSPDALGTYHSFSNLIQIIGTLDKESFERVFLHELLHAVTVNEYYSNKEFSDKINALYNHTLKFKDYRTSKGVVLGEMYGMKNVTEFMSEAISNPDFIYELSKYYSPNEEKLKQKNIFQEFIDLVVKIVKDKIESKGKKYIENNLGTTVLNVIANNAKIKNSNFKSISKLENYQITSQQEQQAKQLYSQYLDTIFPDSKVKDIVYHSRFTVGNIKNKDRWKNGFYSGTKDQADLMADMAESSNDLMTTSALLINMQNPKVTTYADRKVEDYKNTNDGFIIEATEKDALQLIGNRDGYNIENFKKEYVVFEPEQIHILGSKQDIEGFKKFVKIPGEQSKLALQKSTVAEISSEDLNTIIKNFLNKIGVTYEAVESLTDSNGKPINGVALANILDKVIQVIEGKAGLDTLPEEATHFFVAMLPKDSHLYQTMFKSITDYQVYTDVVDEYGEDPLYKGNTVKLKEEAIAKLITQHIIKGFKGVESEKNIQKANNWWNMVWQKIKKMLFGFDKKAFYEAANKANAFEISAQMILKGDVTELTGSLGEEVYLQKSTDEAIKAKDIIESVSDRMSYDKDKVDKPNKKSGYSIKPTKDSTEIKDIKNRTTDLVEDLKKKRGWGERTPEEQKKDEISKQFGTNTHAALKNIIDRYAEKLQDNEVTAKDTFGLSDSKYGQLSNYVTKLLKSYDPGSIILSEVMIYNQNKDLAGTIDLLIIKPDGTIDIYDWKTINMSGKKEIPFYKEEEWNIQLTSYKNTLKSYGLNKFGKLRIIPIATNWDKNMNIQSISIGGENLDQIPATGLQGGDVELTGNPAIDKLIEVLVQRLKKVSELKIPFEDIKKRQLRTARIENLKASIKELQLKQTYDAFLEEAKFELDLMKQSGLKSYDNEELIDARKVTTFYSRILEKGLVSKSILKDNYKDFSKVQVQASEMLADINAQIEERAIDIAESVDIDNLLEAQEEPTVLGRWFRTISQSEHPVIKSFYKLVTKQKDKVYKDSKELHSKIDKSVKDLKEYSKSIGVSGVDIFKPFLKFKDGKWTGNLIGKFKEELYQRRDEALKNKDKESLEFLRENFIFDKEKFTKLRNENIKTWEKLFKTSKYKESIIKKKLADFDAKYNVATNPFTAYGKQNFFLTIKDTWLSEEYKKIQATPALKNFYDLFTSTIAENKEYLDVNLMPSFVPNIRKDLIDGISQNGWSALSGLGESFVDAIKAKSDADYGMVDEATGEYKKTVPIYYTQNISPEMKSMDLGRSLYLFGNMAINHKYMSEIEASSQILQDVLERRSRTIVTDALGKPVKGLSGKIKEKLNSADTLSQFNAFMDYYLYGINTTGADKSIEIKGENISSKKLFSQTLKFFSAKSLSLNVLSGFANFFGGNANALMEGSKGRFYNKQQYYNSVVLLGTKKDIAFQAIEFFDIGSTHTDFQKANKLSASAITKNMTFDKFYVLQQGGEWTVENLTLLAMLQSHTIRDGKIVKKNSNETALIDQMKVVNDKLEVPGLTDEEYAKFRRKVKYLYTTMKGNMGSEDINLVKLTVLGQVMMQFKNWIARMADERFGNLRYTQDLEVWEQGKYVSWFKHASQVITGNFSNLLTSVAGNGILGIGSDMFNNSLIEAGEKHYDTLSPEEKAKMSREDYAEMYAANVRGTAAEIQLLIVCAVLYAALKGDGDDDKDPARRYLIKMANRNLQEISFFINPKSAATITGSGAKTSVPILGLLVDIEEFFSDFIGQGIGVVTGDEERMEKNKPTKKFLNLFPATNSLERLWSEFEDDNE